MGRQPASMWQLSQASASGPCGLRVLAFCESTPGAVNTNPSKIQTPTLAILDVLLPLELDLLQGWADQVDVNFRRVGDTQQLVWRSGFVHVGTVVSEFNYSLNPIFQPSDTLRILSA